MAITNYETVSLETVIKKLPVFIESKIPIIIHGPVGVGKTESIRYWCEQNGYQFYSWILSQVDSLDVRGLVQVETLKDGTKVTSFAPPKELPRKSCGKMIILLDELLAAQPEVHAAITQLLLERRIGEYVLPEEVYIMAATNDVEDGAFVTSENTAINTRVIHFRVKADAEYWLKWATQAGIHPILLSWIKIQPECIYDTEALNDDVRIFNNPRTIEAASKVLFCTEKIEGKDAINSISTKAVLAGTIGQKAAAKLAFVMDQILSLHPLQDYYKAYMADPKSVKELTPKTLSSLYGLAYSLSQELSTLSGAKANKKAEVIFGVMYELCTIEDGLSREEIFTMFLDIAYGILNTKNPKVLNYLLDSELFQLCTEKGINTINYINS